MEVTIVVDMYTEHVSWRIIGKDGPHFSGSDVLSSFNGCYDSLLSASMNRLNGYCKNYNYEIVDFIFSKK